MISNNAARRRKFLSGDGLFGQIYSDFQSVPDYRQQKKINIDNHDALMSAFSMFSLKEPSLLQFQENSKNDVIASNLHSIYRINVIPSDTQMREIIDPIDPFYITPIFKNIFNLIQRGKGLDEFKFLGKYYLTSIDGTGYFSSKNIHCENCQVKNHRNGEITYSHAMLGAAVVHPDKKEVIPLAPEPIIKQDGTKKNDCERNAAKRMLNKIKKDHPHLPIIVVEDALASNAPHIEEMERHDFRYILGVKPGDHKYLFDLIKEKQSSGDIVTFEVKDDGIIHRFNFINNVPLNESNPDRLVNFLEYFEIKNEGTQHFSWITDFEITNDNVFELMRGGRARWKIENETFNTLKNQGYQFEHNFGHGSKNLSVNFATLMMLAFLVDQTQQICCNLFQKTLKKEKRKIKLWESIRVLFKVLVFKSWEMLLKAIYFGYKVMGFQILEDNP